MKFNCGENNSILVRRLNRLVCEEKVAHAYLFEGSSDTDNIVFAKSFVKGVLCPKNLGENCGECELCAKIDHDNHEDIYYPEKNNKTSRGKEVIDTIEEKLNIKPIGDRNVVIMRESDIMTPEAQNRFLKILEEPPGNSLIILLAENIENLKPTVLSRCVKYRIDNTNTESSDPHAETIISMVLSGTDMLEINKEIAEYTKDREKCEQLLNSMEVILMNRIKNKDESISLNKFDDLYDIMHDIERCRVKIHQNYSIEYSLKDLIINNARFSNGGN